jgi:hypothetical protein
MDFTGLLDVWGPGQLLAFSGLDGPTDFNQGLVLRTAGPGSVLECRLPGILRLVLDDGLPRRVRLTGDCFDLVTAAGPVRGAFLDACHLLLAGPVRVVGADPALAVIARGDRTLLAAAARCRPELIDADLDAAVVARLAWLIDQDLPAAGDPALRRVAAKCLSQFKTMILTPEGSIRHRWSTPDRWPHRRMWLWDSAFHAIGCRHGDAALARDLLDAVCDRQLPDGRIAHCVDPYGDPSAVTQPPVLALAAALVDEVAPDDAWLADIYPRLAAALTWNAAHRDAGDGLLAWHIDERPHCRCGESGMDNSPRFDAPLRLAATDFNSFQAHDYEIMAGFAERLGRPSESAAWRERHRRLVASINARLWDPATAFYCDHDAAGASTGVVASAGFLPLLGGAVPPERVRALVAALRDPTRFGTRLPVPSIAADHPAYQPDMWCGPVWLNLNWLIARGLLRAGQPELAAAIREKSLAAVAEGYERHGCIFEYYDDRGVTEPPALRRKGDCDPANPMRQVIHDYGWTATLVLDWLATPGR